jgi:hypothetical protein
MNKSNILKSAFVFIFSVFLFSCERERNSDGNLDQFRLTATFDSGESITFKQFNPDESDAGLLICNCVFYDDQYGNCIWCRSLCSTQANPMVLMHWL